MKKLFVVLLILTASLFVGFITAYAEVGDVVDTIYTTDILTQVDGRDIKSYAIDGRTMIALEDLKDYGFTVYYDNDIRTLFVTKTGTVDPDFNPSIPRGREGGTDGYVYETDIKAYLNGVRIDAYAIDGKMAAKVEEMGERNISGIYTEKTNTYQMGFAYDDSQRLLSLDTNLLNYIDPETAKQNYAGRKRALTPMQSLTKNILHNRNVWLMQSTRYDGWSNGYSYNYSILYSNGLFYDLWDILRAYDMWAGYFDSALSADGAKIYFKYGYENNYTLMQMELDSLRICPLHNADEYNKSAMTVTSNDMNLEINGVSVPLYKIGGHDYIRVSDFASCGFNVSRFGDLFVVIHRSDMPLGEPPQAVPMTGYANRVDTIVSLNGSHITDVLELNGDYFVKALKLGRSYIHAALGSSYDTGSEYETLSIDYSTKNNLISLTSGANSTVVREYNKCKVDGRNYGIVIAGIDDWGVNYIQLVTDEGCSEDVDYCVLLYLVEKFGFERGEQYYNSHWDISHDIPNNNIVIKIDGLDETYLFDLDTFTIRTDE